MDALLASDDYRRPIPVLIWRPKWRSEMLGRCINCFGQSGGCIKK